jgi:hypothetical protein
MNIGLKFNLIEVNRDNMGDEKYNGRKNSDQQIGRRRYLKSASMFGGIAALNPFIGNEDIRTKRVPEILRGSCGEVVEWMEVPRAWKKHERYAKKVKEQLADQLLGKGPIEAVGLTTGDKKYGGWAGSVPIVKIKKTIQYQKFHQN